jgi:hypothetical protein
MTNRGIDRIKILVGNINRDAPGTCLTSKSHGRDAPRFHSIRILIVSLFPCIFVCLCLPVSLWEHHIYRLADDPTLFFTTTTTNKSHRPNCYPSNTACLPSRLAPVPLAMPSTSSRNFVRAGRVTLAMAAVVCLLLYTGFDASKLRQSQGLGFAASYASSYSFSSETSSVPLDPVAQPGWIEGDTWVSANPEAPMHNWIRRIMDKEEGPDMDWMRNKTIVRRPTVALPTAPQNITSGGKG